MSTNDPGRQTWSRQIEFLFVIVGQGVGFGNVWRFPYICYRNGGGVFFIPYILAVFLLGIPLCFLEGSLGQFTSRGVIAAFKIVPLVQGIGVTITILGFLGMSYYSVLFAWVLYYLFSSFSAELPWSHCNNDWNTEKCTTQSYRNNFSHIVTNVSNSHYVYDTEVNISGFSTDPATEFWERKVLNLSPGIDQIGSVKWDLSLCYLLAWILIYFCIWKGVGWMGKISYVTATVPYILLTALLIYGATLEGAVEGIKLYLLPNWSRLTEPKVWYDASVQVFYSYGVGVAIHTTLGSSNVFHHNILKHYFWFALINSGSSFLCGLVIFTALGFMAHQQGVSVDKVAESGPGLVFIAYPQALSQMPIPQLWAVLFFLMLCFIAIDSEFACTDAIIVSLSDLLPSKFSRSPGKEVLSAGLCSIWFLIGLSMTTEGGIYIQQMIEWYCAGKIIFITVFLECVVVAYLYGVNRYQKNLEYMLGYRIGPYFKYVWLFVCPSICLVLLISDAILYPDLQYKRKLIVYNFPLWSRYVGWSLTLCSSVSVPLVMIWRLATTPGTFIQRFRHLLLPEFTVTQKIRDRGILGCELMPGPEEISLNP